ncbi:MAG: hypothetical protein BGO98_37050 [Myxococcales bacterium 68-20]|nr:hypothetical protein [Myxococcales bacterium]OJY14816.1 MAG: hypothetical protein BGO98_37050 [Myxococcales bacterium 68-20]
MKNPGERRPGSVFDVVLSRGRRPEGGGFEARQELFAASFIGRIRGVAAARSVEELAQLRFE